MGAETSVAGRILASVARANAVREARAGDAPLQQRAEAVKAHQRRRLEQTYADVLADRRQGPAMRFLIDECHGSGHSGRRMGRIAPIIATLAVGLPGDLVETFADFAEFQALSEVLDTELARRCAGPDLSEAGYQTARRAAAQEAGRAQQLALMLTIGRRLDRLTGDPLLAASLRLLRGPAWLTGLGPVQAFLAQGFDAFASLRGAGPLLTIIEGRERAFLALLVTDPASSAD